MTASRAPKILTRYGPTPNITSARPGRAPGAARRNPAIELRDGSGFSVHLSYGTRARIEDEIGDARRRFGEFVETGGWLYAQRPPVVDAYICHASGPGRESRHEPTSTRISSPRTVEAEFSDDLVRAELCRVGCWHAHGWPDPQPSDTDLRTWAKARSDFGLDRWAQLSNAREQLELCGGQSGQVICCSRPPDIGIAPDGAQARARSVHQHEVEHAISKGEAPGCRHPQDGGRHLQSRQRLAKQSDAPRPDIAGGQEPTNPDPGRESHCLPTR